jgi:glyoxalase family protein
VIQINHVAAFSSNFNKTIQFYRDVLGLSVIHKFSLFGGPKVCHFYWNEKVDKFITFYHCPGLRNGKRGTGTAHTISFSVCLSSLLFWINRLQKESIQFKETTDPFKHLPVLCFKDPDGLTLKLVFIKELQSEEKGHSHMPPEFSITGVYAIEILSGQYLSFANLFLDQLNMNCRKVSANRYRFLNDSHCGDSIDVTIDPRKEKGASGCGTIHHIALKIYNWVTFVNIYYSILDKQKAIITRSHSNGHHSIYFWLSDGILFELLGQNASIKNAVLSASEVGCTIENSFCHSTTFSLE